MKKERPTNHLQPCQEWTEKLILRPEDLSSTDRASRDIHVQTCPACQSLLEDYQSLKTLLEISPLTIMPLPRLANSFEEEEDEGNREPPKGLYREIPSQRKRVHERNRAVLADRISSYLEGIILAVIIVSFLVLSFIGSGSTSSTNGSGSISSTLVTGDVIGLDTFARANQTLWGTASEGLLWTGDANTLPNFSIVNNTAQIAIGSSSAAGVYNALLGGPVSDAQVLFSGSMNRFSDSSLGSTLRWNDTNNWYKASIDGNSLVIQKNVNGVVAYLAAFPFVASTNTSYTIRFQIVGKNLSAKVWPTARSEPSGWMVTATDSSFSSGLCGLRIQVFGGAKATITSFWALLP